MRSRRRSASTQDATRLGLKSETGKVITAFGVKPVVQVQSPTDNFWLDGVVEPLSGWHFTQKYPHLAPEPVQQFMAALCEQLGDDIAVIQLSQAGAHVTSALRSADNLIPIVQPAHRPELNPIERVWQFIKAQLKGERFATRKQLRARLVQVLAQLTAERIISLSSADFILAALFYAASN